MLRGVHFDFNKSKIRPGDAAVLDEAASTLKANPNVTINVNGYCDAIGGEEYNMKLSDRRSDAVVDYLVKAGIPSSQLIAHGYGKTNFVATNDTAEGRAAEPPRRTGAQRISRAEIETSASGRSPVGGCGRIV